MTRKWVAIAAMLATVASPAAVATALVGVMVLASHAGEHEHALHRVDEDGHRHLVLAHDEHAPSSEGHEAPHGAAGDPVSAGDHVIELGQGVAAGASPRAVAGDPGAGVLVLAVASARVLPCRAHEVPEAGDARVPSCEGLRTTVLRL